ncbi:S-layer homology domain-containing protein [Geosporobacter subterraneus DSM 17957]|uniref:S-layer homology domain-containing protein n=1 Tax=Geosporobacter subterraneus DSM 17957 TaxID=1121919 RepID=A0A1M6PMQ0_9FIRM|nr:NEAT domain-containing protein [Geosporobacter subterraneus]SHK09224.1 S-layer homology domain-containing protein [Geosporobacter subterraneus DSM 17957]
MIQKRILAFMLIVCISCFGLLPEMAFASDTVGIPKPCTLAQGTHEFYGDQVKALQKTSNNNSIINASLVRPVSVEVGDTVTTAVYMTLQGDSYGWEISMDDNIYTAPVETTVPETGKTKYKFNVEKMHTFFYIKGMQKMGQNYVSTTFRLVFTELTPDEEPTVPTEPIEPTEPTEPTEPVEPGLVMEDGSYIIHAVAKAANSDTISRTDENIEKPLRVDVKNGLVTVLMTYTGTMTNMEMSKDNVDFAGLSKASGSSSTYRLEMGTELLSQVYIKGQVPGMGNSWQTIRLVFHRDSLRIPDGNYTITATAKQSNSNTVSRTDDNIEKPLKLEVKDGNITAYLTFKESTMTDLQMSTDGEVSYANLSKAAGSNATYKLELGTKLLSHVHIKGYVEAMKRTVSFKLEFDKASFVKAEASNPGNSDSGVGGGAAPPPFTLPEVNTYKIENGEYTIHVDAKSLTSHERSRIDDRIVKPLKVEVKDGKVILYLTLRGNTIRDIQFRWTGVWFKEAPIHSQGDDTITYRLEMDKEMHSYIYVKGYVEAMDAWPEFGLFFAQNTLKKQEEIPPVAPVSEAVIDQNGFKIRVVQVEDSQLIEGRPLFRVSIEREELPLSHGKKALVSLPYTPRAEELKNVEKIVVYRVTEEGKLIVEPTGKYNSKTQSVEFKAGIGEGTYTIRYAEKSFKDLQNYDWAVKPVEALAAREIIKGMGEGSFSPQASIRRADFIIMLMKALGVEGKPTTNFTDVNPERYYADLVGMAKEMKIIRGDTNGSFRPEAPISRQEMFTIAANALRFIGGLNRTYNKNVLNQFADKDHISAYALDSAAALVSEGIIRGKGTSMDPKSNVRRAEAAVLIYGIYNYEEGNTQEESAEKLPVKVLPVEGTKTLSEGTHPIRITSLSADSNEPSRLNNAIENPGKVEVKDGILYGYLTLKRSLSDMSGLKISNNGGVSFEDAEVVLSETGKTTYRFKLDKLDQPVVASIYVEAMGASPKFRIAFDHNTTVQ